MRPLRLLKGEHPLNNIAPLEHINIFTAMHKVSAFLLKHRNILIIYIIAAIVASISLVLQGNTHVFIPDGLSYTFYNNYIIFKESFFNLINDRDMYILYPDNQWDLYKYSPTFALFMGLLAYLPDVVGLSIWNILNAVVMFYAIRSLPLPGKKRSFILLFIFIELLTSLQNAQSNGLMAGSIILANSFLQRGKPQWATLWLVIGTFIKVYGAVGFCLFLFYPDKIKFILYAVLWTILFAVVPMVVISPGILMDQYASWARMMAEDQSQSYGFSVMGWLNTWFGLSGIKNVVILVGIALFFLPLIKVSLYKEKLYQLLFLAHVLVWVIIFNHKAESSTFVIAVAGIAIWHFSRKPLKWRTIWIWIVFLGTCLTPTDLFPPAMRREILVPYVVKAVPVILTWVIIISEIILLNKERINKEGQALMEENGS